MSGAAAEGAGRPATGGLEWGILFTDHYQLSMSQLYHQRGLADRPARFEHFFRRYPDYGSHQAGYAIIAGHETLLEWMATARFGPAEREVLASQYDDAGRRVFTDEFCDWLLEHGHFDGVSIRAVPEGRVVHAGAPLMIIEGPLVQAQLLETALLNIVNFQTLIATKASRVAEASRGRPVLEFGLRRSAGWGGNAATRAALIGGAGASSNVGMSYRMGLHARGTHAHSMVQAFMALGDGGSAGELDAFRAYAETYPDDCLLLVDTVNTLESGVPNAIRVFDELRATGHEPVGIRLDSGDLAYLAIQSALLLDEAGYDETRIVLSSSLDELLIFQIISQIDQEAPRYGIDPRGLIDRLVMGVGSKLSASEGHPYLDGVYKLVALSSEGSWVPAIKISETPAKTPNPGDKDVTRVYDRRGRSTADLLSIAGESLPADLELHHPIEPGVRRHLGAAEVSATESLLEPLVVDGRPVDHDADLAVLRARRDADVERLDPGVRRLVNPHRYHVSLTPELWGLKQELIARTRA
ncbi:MAG: nicotinate phosphoribosyltransferase [Acidimicrobiales bacterium]